jgi:hypothetical protein
MNDAFLALHGLFLRGTTPLWIVGSVLLLLMLGFVGAPLIVWTIAGLALLAGWAAPAVRNDRGRDHDRRPEFDEEQLEQPRPRGISGRRCMWAPIVEV